MSNGWEFTAETYVNSHCGNSHLDLYAAIHGNGFSMQLNKSNSNFYSFQVEKHCTKPQKICAREIQSNFHGIAEVLDLYKHGLKKKQIWHWLSCYILNVGLVDCKG